MSRLRMATLEDAPAVQAIYAPYVLETAISFELEPPDTAEIARRMESTLQRTPWLVAEVDGRVAGYAYAGRHRERAAYLWSIDFSVYIEREAHGRGIGRALYTALFDIASGQGFVNVYGAITLPNPASVGLHEAMGFRHIGTYEAVGYKLGAWHAVGWWGARLAELAANPVPPVPLPGLEPGIVETALMRGSELLGR